MSRKTTLSAALCSLVVLGLARPEQPNYQNLNAVLWVQTSVEYKASAVQTYRLAKAALRKGLKDPHWTAALEQNGEFENLPPAVILDLDETVLDNSALEARLTASGETFSDPIWTRWMQERNAGLVPGAMDFLQFAHANGVAPIYITNRVCDPGSENDPTVQLLRNLHLPLDPVKDRLFCDDSSKEITDKDYKIKGDKTERRRKCAAKFRILLLFGDQLGDFLQIPANSSDLGGREELFESHQSLWGERWFQLSNPMYGSWEDAVGYSMEKMKHLRK